MTQEVEEAAGPLPVGVDAAAAAKPVEVMAVVHGQRRGKSLAQWVRRRNNRHDKQEEQEE